MTLTYLFATTTIARRGQTAAGCRETSDCCFSRCSVRNRRTRSVLSGRDGATEISMVLITAFCCVETGTTSANRKILPAVVSERFVRFRHLVRVFLLLDRVAAVVRG